MARRRKPILRFFKRKTMDEQQVQNIDETPVVEAPAEQVAVPIETETTPDVVAAIEEQENVQDENTEMVEKKTEVSEPTSSEDRSAHNCPTCSGNGLIKGPNGDDIRCSQCGGTGKI